MRPGVLASTKSKPVGSAATTKSNSLYKSSPVGLPEVLSRTGPKRPKLSAGPPPKRVGGDVAKALSAAVINTLPISAKGVKAEVLAKSIQQAVLKAVPSITPKQAEVAFAKAQSSMQPHETVYLPIGSLASAVSKTRGEVTASPPYQLASDPSNLTVLFSVSSLSVTPNTCGRFVYMHFGFPLNAAAGACPRLLGVRSV